MQKLLVRGEYWLGNAFIAVLVFQILLLAQHTFTWRYGEDVGFFYYFSWLMNERDYLPYRDLHETSFPGSFLLYGLITRITGYSVTAYNITHMVLFAGLCTCSYTLLQRIDKRMAIAATCLFGSDYFFMHRSMHMQRDFLVLLFVIMAITAMTSRWKLLYRSLAAGLLFGIASAIKPHAALAAPFAVLVGAVMQIGTARNNRSDDSRSGTLFRQCILAAGVSLGAFLLVWACITAYLVTSGSWPSFYSMLTEYMPLYQKMNGIHIAISVEQRWEKALGWFSERFLIGAIPVIPALISCWKNPALGRQQKLLIVLLAMLWPVYIAYVSMSGKLWDYHQIPMNYFFSTLLCLYFIPFMVSSWKTVSLRIVSLSLGILFLQMSLSPNYALAVACLKSDPVCNTEEEAAYAIEDHLENFLRQTVKPGEKVEPLATSTLGPLFPAMLRAGIEPATPYVEGFPLYHDADTRYVQQIRADMLGRLQASPPRFIIRPVNFFAPGGPTASPFTGLDNFIAAHYRIVNDRDYPQLGAGMPVTIYEHRQ